MTPSNVYRIYTEKKNKRAILDLVGQEFESFTVQATSGYYRGHSEKSIVIEIVGASARAIKRIAEQIRKMNGQKSVLVLKLNARSQVKRG
jgi:acetolactate synthase regulatory subunit